ncbi:MAG: FtsQ-type POTRA domain-containing protein [Oscillospiraceae bacterium]|nr:FtsQ-type POTRA domain-containing protein [Oscillospiraceae bacterium]
MPKDRKKRRRRGKVGFLLTFLVIAFLLLLILSSGLFFKVSDIRVEGAYAVSPERVIELSGYAHGDNMFLLNKAAAARAVTAGMPYVRSVRIKRDWPGRVVIVVSEAAPAAMAAHEGEYWLFDAQGRLLETARLIPAPKLPNVKGLSFLDPMVGTKVFPIHEDTAKLEPLLSLLRAMQTENLWHDVAEIDISALSNVRFTYTEQYRVEMGPPEAMEKKLQIMMLALERESVSGRGPGTFYLADAAEDKPVRFVPDGN